VAWYAAEGRLHPAADGEVALQQAVDAWAADVAAGHPTGRTIVDFADDAGVGDPRDLLL
jgi:hypothetical protein